MLGEYMAPYKWPVSGRGGSTPAGSLSFQYFVEVRNSIWGREEWAIVEFYKQTNKGIYHLNK